MPHMDSTEANLADILSTLESKGISDKERCDTYNKLTRLFRENEENLFETDVSKTVVRVLNVIKTDVNSSSQDVTNVALQILGACLYSTDIVSHIKKADCIGMLQILCSIVHNTKEKSTCSSALWCLKSQNIDATIIADKTDEIVTAVEFAMENWSGISVSVVHECISTVERLNSQVPEEMAGMTLRWGKLLLPLVIHRAIQVREGALDVIVVKLDLLKKVHNDLIAALKPLIKQKIIPGLKSFFNEGQKVQVYSLKCWGTLVQLFGEELHHASYINEFLPVVELGFKSTEPRVKVAAFQAWRQLIDNFSISQSVIQDPKRIKLIMQVFKHNNARTESVALEKLTCWWHFLWLLGNKVSPNFDMVASPLLHFCIGGKQSDQNGAATPKPLKPGASPVTPHLKLSNAGSHELPVFKSLQLLGCEALAHFLGNVEVDNPHHKFKLDPLTHEVVTGPSFFIKHSSLLITSAVQLFCSLGDDAPESLVLHTWQWLIAHLKNAIDSPAKIDIRETLSILFQQFQVLVLSRVLSNEVILKMFCSLCFLPKKILCSSAYSIGAGEMIHGTPALFITGLLLTPVLLSTCSTLDSYHDLFSSLLANGTGNSTGSLGFLQSVVEIMKENASSVQDKETLWRLWSAIEHPLLLYISKTNEINQGDSLEHDFGCSVQALVFPVVQDLHELPQPLVKSLIKSWSELYKTVNRLAAMVANAESNIVCEEVCSQVLDHYLEKDTVEATQVDMLVQICRVVVTSLYFSSLDNQQSFKMMSPKKFAKNRHKPLENIHSVVALLGLLQKKAISLVPDSDSLKKSTGVSVQIIMNNLVETFSTIFVHVNSSNMISNLIGQLARPIGDLLTDAQKKTSTKVYNSSFQSKLEKLWMDISTCIQSRYTGMFDSDFLEKCTPLLEATFLHSRRQMKNQAMSFWTSTFGKTSYLNYPEPLKPILSKVKAKTMIQLPNWVATISPVIDETPVSQMTQTQAPEPRLPGMPSPHKIHGSFLNKPVSPKLNRSPVRAQTSPLTPASAKKKKLNLDGFQDGDFVLIKHTPKNKMVLTDHQKEVLKEKRTLPAMYNGLDQSVDASLMAAHFTTDTQMDGSLSETPTPTTSQPFSLFGSCIPPTNPEGKEKDHTQIKKRLPVSNKLENMKALEKMKQMEAKKKKSDTDSDSAPRRSSRVIEHVEKEESSQQQWTQFCFKKAEPSQTQKESEKEYMKENTFGSNPIVIDNEDDPTDTEFGNDEPTAIKSSENDEPSDKNLTNNKNDVGGSGEHTFKGKLDENQKKAESERDVDSSDKDSKSSEGQVGSVPQNVLDAIGFFQSLSSKARSSGKSSISTNTSKSGKEISGQEEKASTDNESDVGDSRTVVSKDEGVEHENSASQPLISWTQKLNELSTSPRPVSPVVKWSSQDSAVSVEKKSKSTKLVKRGRKKPVDENEEKGTLTKWVIRSPAKNFNENLNTDFIVANVSQTLVEETQSPTKFTSKGKTDKGLSSSIMETPPKTVLENITVSHSNSNRKLFSSQSSNTDYKIVEDSNIVPASPNSKSFRCGTPVLKLKKLTNEEILRYSPSRRKGSESDDKYLEYTDKSKRSIIVGEAMTNNKSHDHDDFSAFIPLEKGLKDVKYDGFFSSQPTDTEEEMLKLSDNNNSAKLSECSGSENLFSQTEQLSCENVTATFDEGNDSQNSLSKSEEKVCFQSQALDEHDIEDIEITKEVEDTETNEKETVESDKSFNPLSPVNTQDEGAEKRGRGRKRKQITPKKLTPEDIKLKKKREQEENKVVVKKLSKRMKKGEKSETDKDEMGCKKSKINEKAKSSPENGNTLQKKSSGKKGKIKQKDDNNLKKGHVSSSRRGKSNNSGSPNSESTDASSADSSHEELEVSVFDDILDLEEDSNCVKTLKEIKKDLKKKKFKLSKKDGKKKELINASETVNQTDKKIEPVQQTDLEAQNNLELNTKAKQRREDTQETEPEQIIGQETEHVQLAEPVTSSCQPLGSLKKKVEDEPTFAASKNGTCLNVVGDLHVIGENGDNFVTGSVPQVEDICDVETDAVVSEATGKVKINESENKTLPAEAENEDVHNHPNPTEMDLGNNGVPFLDMDNNVPFIAVKLGDDQISQTLECKIDGTISSPTTDQNVDYLEIVIESSDEEDLPDIDQRSSEDDKSKQNLNEKNKDAQCGKDFNDGKDESFFSDDDVPIAEMTAKVIEKDKEDRKVSMKKGGTKARQKLQPSTRLRTNERKLGNVGKTTKNDNKIDKVDKLVSPAVNLIENLDQEPKESQDNAISFEETEVDNSTKGPEAERRDDIIDETPRKEPDVSKSSMVSKLMMRHSDSKLILGSRRFEKKGSFARRSILKPTSEGSFEVTQSPRRTPFHPITVGRIYSPTASPSASILKKRRFSDDTPAESNSPPAKQRRVSFATPLADVTRVDTARPPSPLVKKSGIDSTQDSVSLTLSGKFIETQSTPGSPSQKNYESSQDTQINNTDPVCPELIGCDQSVEKILPQLTSSIWSRGLGQLVRARNIRTIGDLSSLSEGDIHGLPIRSPKVDTVKKVLTKFGKNIGSTRPKRSTILGLESPLKSAETQPEIKQPAENIPTMVSGIADKEIADNVEALLANSGSLLDEVNNLVADSVSEHSEGPKAPEDQQKTNDVVGSKSEFNLTEALLHYCDKNRIDFESLSANELVKLSQNLTAMLAEVNKAIETVVSTRCLSPWR